MSKIDTKGRNADIGWDAIDIFLFSNGQKSTPPRKYHLQANELDWWEATLNYLAKSHFGTSQTAIELYTLDGNKVQGPLELSNGAPYVAVVPPDTFTNAGYEHYLMKASRSWEKRNAKKENIGEESEVQCSVCVSSKPCCPCVEKTVGPLQISTVALVPVSEFNNIKAPEEPYGPASSVMVKPEPVVTHTSDKPAVRQPPKSIIPQNDRRRPSGTRTSFLRSSTPAAPRRNSSINKDDNRTKIIKRISIQADDPVSPATDRPKGTAKSVNNKPPESLRTISKTPPPQKCEAMTTVNSKGFVTDSLSIRDLNDKEILLIATDANVADNVKSNLNALSAVRPNTYYPPTVDEIISCHILLPCIEEETQTTIEMSTREANTTHDSPHLNTSKIKVISAIRNSSPSNVLNCDVALGDNCVAVINKGEAVNLKLDIELQNDSEIKDVSNNGHKNVRKASSLSDLFKQRLIQSDDEAGVPTTSLESVICDINECYAKIVMVQCSCCGNKTAVPRMSTLPVYKDPNGFFILMPTAGQYGIPSCLCCPNHERLCPDKAAMSSCVEDLCKPKSSTIYPYVTQNVGGDDYNWNNRFTNWR